MKQQHKGSKRIIRGCRLKDPGDSLFDLAILEATHHGCWEGLDFLIES